MTCSCGLFKAADCIASNGGMSDQIAREVEEVVVAYFKVTTSDIRLEGLRKTTKLSGVGFPAEIRTGHLPNK
jgi:hypothetical protein